MSKPTVLLTGKNGQLGNELRLLFAQYPQFNYVLTDAGELDIADEAQVNACFEKFQPVICINAAAYTAVDKAETERELALRINATAVGYLAAACKKANARFIQVSTDYVFDGTGSEPYREDHPVSPVNYYGFSKLKGEEAALSILPSTVVIRTSWVYSFFGNNFVKTMLRLMKERPAITVIDDQFGSPTYAADLAAAIMQIAVGEAWQGGIYHFSNDGVISWFDFAIAIKTLAKAACEVKPIDTSGYPTPARRPAYSVMDKTRIQSVFGITLQPWRDSLQRCIDLLQQ